MKKKAILAIGIIALFIGMAFVPAVVSVKTERQEKLTDDKIYIIGRMRGIGFSSLAFSTSGYFANLYKGTPPANGVKTSSIKDHYIGHLDFFAWFLCIFIIECNAYDINEENYYIGISWIDMPYGADALVVGTQQVELSQRSIQWVTVNMV